VLNSHLGNTERIVLVLALGPGQSGQHEAKMSKKILHAKMLNNILTLSQNFQEYFKIKPKCSGQNMIWFVLKFCGSGYNT
jgi:hypothetical protein